MANCRTCQYMIRTIDDIDDSTKLIHFGTCRIKLPPFVAEKSSLDRQVDVDKYYCSFHTFEELNHHRR